MSYIGNQPLSSAFVTDQFSGNGSTVAFTMSVAPANTSSVLVAVSGVMQDPSTYSVNGLTLTFSQAPPLGLGNISVRYLGVPASGVTTTAYRTVTEFTASSGQTTFTTPSYTVGYIDVYRNGVRLSPSDFTASNGTTVVLLNSASAGDTVVTESFYVSSVVNAIQQYNGSSYNQLLITPVANTLTSASGQSLRLQTNGGTTVLTLDTAGNGGLGVTPSAWASGFRALQVSANTALWSSTTSGSGPTYLSNNVYFDGARKYIGTGSATEYQQNAGSHIWLTTGSGSAGGTISFTQAMTLDASGNLGIGTTSPLQRLDVASSNTGVYQTIRSTSSGATNVALRIQDGTTGTGNGDGIYLGRSGAENYLWTYENEPWAFGTNNTERARISSDGNFLIGTSDASSTSGPGLKFLNDSEGAGSDRTAIVVSSTTNSQAPFTIYSTGAAAFRFYVGAGGTVYATSTTITGISDVRLKENIRDLDDGLEKIMALQPRKFDWKEGKGKGIANDRGFIAQEFETVFPDMIETWQDPAPEGEEPYKAVNANLIPTLVKAIQELKAIVDAQAAEIAALKGQA
jgi:hypothetical protein